MKFGDLPIQSALACILAHTLRVDGITLKKGLILDENHIRLLASKNIDTVVVARFEDGDVDEDLAAGRIAAAICGENITPAEPFTGRANIFANYDGVFVSTTETIIKLNSVDEAMTIASLRPLSRVNSGQMVATVKIIPFCVSNSKLIELESFATQNVTNFSLAPFRPLKVGLIITRLPGGKDSVMAKRHRSVAERISSLGGTLEQVVRCDHALTTVSIAIQEMRRCELDLILVFGASAIVDRADVIPAALEKAGGEILHLGMPVDPGNLLLYGRFADVPVVGIPSCAASIKENGFDWVLERIFADLPLNREDFIVMASGGLLMEIASRPQPREMISPDAKQKLAAE